MIKSGLGGSADDEDTEEVSESDWSSCRSLVHTTSRVTSSSVCRRSRAEAFIAPEGVRGATGIHAVRDLHVIAELWPFPVNQT